MSSRLPRVLRLLSGLLALATTKVSAQSYLYTDLGTLGGQSSYATAINNSGQVVGYSAISGYSPEHAFLYSGGAMTDLGTLGGSSSRAYAINGSGQVTGIASRASNFGAAFLYSGGTMTDLGNLTANGATGTAINSSGLIVGNAQFSGFGLGFSSSGGGQIVDLGISASTFSQITGVNSSGQIVGQVLAGGFLLSGVGGSMTMLGASFNPTAINDSGVIVGSAPSTDTYTHPFSFISGTTTDLGALYSPGPGVATAVNSSGQIVGYSNQRAFIFAGGAMRDLNTLTTVPGGVLLQTAMGINDLGQIVGYTTGSHAYLLTPIPEVSTYAALLGAGALGIAAACRRRRAH